MLRRAVLLGDGQADRFQQRRDLPLDGPGLGGDPLDVPGQAIAARLNSLAHGYSGVRYTLLQRLAD
ncbi:hypothetical protein ACQCRC_11260, partial [Ralstonia pseudosolanacearum]|uniref:hypothetical protein n=1 Tax=Ralstonia pseudosolanacearum TaxID=1310165 RepID=UPI003CEB222B